MRAGKSFTDILAMRGRVVLFTPSAAIGLRFEQHAERHHATVICTRGWADKQTPIAAFHRLHVNREYGVLSCDQRTYNSGWRIPATDLVWVGEIGDPLNVPHLWGAFQQAMARGANEEEPPRQWLLAADAL